MTNNPILSFFLIISCLGFSQSYNFKTIVDLEATEVINQGQTGTCWSFSTSSFLESEIIRLTGKQIDLSEMYTVRQTYLKKSWNYVMRQGKIQFSQGGLAHDVMDSAAIHGLVPSHAFLGLENSNSTHNHSEMITALKGLLNAYINSPEKKLSPRWKEVVQRILDIYLGENVTTFNYEGISYTPKSFLEMTKIKPEDYISVTSFMHQPFYTNFVLNIPDNFSNGRFYNVTLDDMSTIVNNALENGFTIALDCDVSEKTFSSKHGIAVIPEDNASKKKALTTLQPEKTITQAYRQQEFENYNTTDDHLMHITGILKDQNGTIYYKVKNSWGKDSDRVSNGGYVYMSAAYFKLKTISIMLHKDAIPQTLRKKMKLN
ncbi:MAG: aminopeptidase [Flavobacteriaceae bacterium]|nr:aminopeptidase [Flavobacteriaceae bacterium]